MFTRHCIEFAVRLMCRVDEVSVADFSTYLKRPPTPWPRAFCHAEFELAIQHAWGTRAGARCAIFRYIDTRYDRKGRHSTLGYVSPAEYEAQFMAAA